MDKDLNLKTKYILEPFFITSSIFLLIIMSLFVPIIGILFVPIPIVLLFLKYNKYIKLLSIATSLIIPSILFSSILPLALGCIYTIIGIILAVCIKKNIKFINTICILSILVVISNLINLFINIYVILKSNLWKFTQDIIANFNESIKIYSELNIDTSNSQHIQNINKIMTPHNILSILPAIIIIFSIIIAFLIYVIMEKTLSKNNYKINKVTNFNRWYLEPKLGAILIIITCLSMVIYSNNIFIAEYVYKTSYSLLQFFMMIIGLSVINYFLKNKMKFNKKVCIGISIVILISPLNALLIVIGLVDLIADIRGIDPNSLGTTLRKKLFI